MAYRNDETFGHSLGQARYPGVTKREYFAAIAMQGILSGSDDQKIALLEMAEAHDVRAKSLLADLAVQQADALIEALNKDATQN